MPLADLLNVPKDSATWEIWSFANRDINTQIRQAIRKSSGGIAEIAMTSNGGGYTSAPTVTITDAKGSGSGATAVAAYSVSGGFYSIAVTILTPGALYIQPIVAFSGGGGTGATAEAVANPIINLTEYQLQPINFDRFTDFLDNNQQAHTDFNGVLGLQSSDLEEVDIKDKKQLDAWIWLNYLELYSACSQLKI